MSEKTLSEFTIGKLEIILERLKKDMAADSVSVAHYCSGKMAIHLTVADLENELSSINQKKNTLIEYFGLNESEVTVRVYGSTKPKIVLIIEKQNLEIEVERF